MTITRIYPERTAFCHPKAYGQAPTTDAQWIWHPHATGFEHDVLLFSCDFKLKTPDPIRLHVSADQRFELYLNGTRVGAGPERGDPHLWFVHSYQCSLPEGDHRLVARVWWIGDMAPYAQMSLRGGFFVFAEDNAHALLSTGVAPWKVTRIHAYRFERSELTWGAQARHHIDGKKWLPAFRTGEDDCEWLAASNRAHTDGVVTTTSIDQRWWLQSATLPDMLYQPIQHMHVRHACIRTTGDTHPTEIKTQEHDAHIANAFTTLLTQSIAVQMPPHTHWRVLIDLDQYYCAYPTLSINGGAGSVIHLNWAESLFHDPESFNKGNRDFIEGKTFHGDGDTFAPDGRTLTFDLLWWRCGRYIELRIETADETLTIDALHLYETRYPLEQTHHTACNDERITQAIPLMTRCLHMCAHETYMDCPYYEQLMYVGDTRLEILSTYVTTQDDRLPRKALRMFDASRQSHGFTQSRYPCRVTQVIPPFSLWWICMLHDYFMWRDDMNFVRELLPGAHAILDACMRTCDQNGVLHPPDGWNFVDWVPTWPAGVPPKADDEPNGIINLQYLMALHATAHMEETLGNPLHADLYRQRANTLATQIHQLFWDKKRGLFAYDLAHEHYSEHMQALAIISGIANESQRNSIAQQLASSSTLEQTTWYFTHYLFDALASLYLTEEIFTRMSLWHALVDQGFRTLPECPDPCRSDCHAWSAHPLYHHSATVLGVRPAAPGFTRVQITPRLGHLTSLKGTVPHPHGTISVAIEIAAEQTTIDLSLPASLEGEVIWHNTSYPVGAGSHSLTL